MKTHGLQLKRTAERRFESVTSQEDAVTTHHDAVSEDKSTTPLFTITSSGDENVAREYNPLINVDVRNIESVKETASISDILMPYVIPPFKYFSHSSELFGCKMKYPVTALAFEDYILVQDKNLHSVKELGDKPKWIWKENSSIQGGYRTIEGRKVKWDDQEWIRFNYDEVVAAFYSKNLIVLRFCWGENVYDVWDVVIDAHSIIDTTIDDFINAIEPHYKDKAVTEDVELSKNEKNIRLMNKSANPRLVGRDFPKTVEIYDMRKAPSVPEVVVDNATIGCAIGCLRGAIVLLFIAIGIPLVIMLTRS